MSSQGNKEIFHYRSHNCLCAGLPVCTGKSKRAHPFGRLNEGSPEGGEIRNLPPLACLCILSARTERMAYGKDADTFAPSTVCRTGHHDRKGNASVAAHIGAPREAIRCRDAPSSASRRSAPSPKGEGFPPPAISTA